MIIYTPLFFIASFITLTLINSKITYDTVCTLTNANPVNPFPNLKKCYKFNDASCCTILHDTKISEFTSSYIIDACLRKYPEFEELLCFACSPLHPNYIDTANSKFRICEDFAMKIWNATTPEQLNEKSYRFDNCGFLIPDGSAFDSTPDHQGFFLPSTRANFADFINNIGIPYFNGYTVEVVKGDNTTCFTKGYTLYHSMLVNILFLLVILI